MAAQVTELPRAAMRLLQRSGRPGAGGGPRSEQGSHRSGPFPTLPRQYFEPENIRSHMTSVTAFRRQDFQMQWTGLRVALHEVCYLGALPTLPRGSAPYWGPQPFPSVRLGPSASRSLAAIRSDAEFGLGSGGPFSKPREIGITFNLELPAGRAEIL
jgi:hypothetical protein